MKLVTKPTTMKPAIEPTLLPFKLREFFSAVPADCQEQIDRETLVYHVREFEFDLEDWNQESQIEEKQKWLEQIVREIVPEFFEDRDFRSFLAARRFPRERSWPPQRRCRRRLAFRF